MFPHVFVWCYVQIAKIGALDARNSWELVTLEWFASISRTIGIEGEDVNLDLFLLKKEKSRDLDFLPDNGGEDEDGGEDLGADESDMDEEKISKQSLMSV